MKKYLIVETFPNTPHIETAVEIALKLKKKNNIVFFFWCGYDLPWVDWELSWYKKIILFSFEKKIERIKRYLIKKKINIVSNINLNPRIENYIDKKVSNHDNFDKLKNFKYKRNFSAGIACLSSFISRYHGINSANNHNSEIPKALKAGCIVYERVMRVIKDINPDKVVTFNSRFIISKPIIDAANKKKKKILIHERGSTPKKYMIHDDDIFDRKYYKKMVKYAWYKNKKINKSKKINIAKKYFNLIIKKKFYTSLGLPFELKSINKIELSRTHKIITFFCSTDYEYTSFSLQKKKYNFYINSKWINQINAIKSLINVIKEDKNIFLFIKAHPNFSKKNSIENQLHKLESSNVTYLSNSLEVDSIYLLKNSDVVVTFGSTLELVAKYLNKKVIPMFKHLYSELGLFRYPKDEKSLKSLIYNKHEVKKNSEDMLFKIAYFLMTFGTNYKFFKSSGFFRGNLVEEKINHFGPIINFLIKLKFLKY